MPVLILNSEVTQQWLSSSKKVPILIILILILIMSLPIVGDKSVGANSLWLSHRVPSCLKILPAS